MSICLECKREIVEGETKVCGICWANAKDHIKEIEDMANKYIELSKKHEETINDLKSQREQITNESERLRETIRELRAQLGEVS